MSMQVQRIPHFKESFEDNNEQSALTSSCFIGQTKKPRVPTHLYLDRRPSEAFGSLA